MQAITNDGATIELPVSGNITSIQITDVTFKVNQTSAKTTISFTVTGQSGTTGASNVTIPKNLVPYGTTPIIYIDNQLCQDQGYTEDAANYYVWYTTHFSTHEVSIEFLGNAPQEFPLLPVVAVVVAEIVVGVAVVLVLGNRGKKATPSKTTEDKTLPPQS